MQYIGDIYTVAIVYVNMIREYTICLFVTVTPQNAQYVEYVRYIHREQNLVNFEPTKFF